MEQIISELSALIPIVSLLLNAGKSLHESVKEIFGKHNCPIPKGMEEEIINKEKNNDVEGLIEIIKVLIENGTKNNNQISNAKDVFQIINPQGSIEINSHSGIEGKPKTTNSVSGNELLVLLEEKGITTIEEVNKLLLNSELLNQFEQKGIVGVRNKNDDHKVTKKISEAEFSIKIMAYYGDGILNNVRKDIIKVITDDNKSVEVRLLFAKKGSVLLDEVLELEDAPEGNTIYDYAGSHISEIIRETPKKPDKLEVREYNTQIRYALIIVDNKWAWWTPYHPGVTTEESLSFELIKGSSNSFIDLCIRHFDKLWSICKRREEGVSNND